MRGFELFSGSAPATGDEVFLFVNRHVDLSTTERLMRALERLEGLA